MSRCQTVSRPLARHLSRHHGAALRSFTSSTTHANDMHREDQKQPGPLELDPETVLPEFEEFLRRAGKMPIGSQRRRAAKRTTGNIPFEQLPYQAFQEARKILAADREEKIAKIKEQGAKIALLEAKSPDEVTGGQAGRNARLDSLRRHVEQLKILADVNDPAVKKRFEDGLGDMNKPIYRYYAERKWRSYQARLIRQRIDQFHIVPDVLPKLEPSADVQLYFRRAKIAPGSIVDSLVSENAPRLRVQVFDRGERLVSVVVLDADVPDTEANVFFKRCHYLAVNVPLSPVQTSVPLGKIRGEDQLAVPWLPAFSQKGAPYHRLGIYLLEQRAGEKLDVCRLKSQYGGRDGFSLKSFRDKFHLRPFGFNMFRSVWDDNTAAVMARHGLAGGDVELRRARVHSLKPPVKPRGWEAKRQGPKYRHLWRYTKRIRGLSNGRGWTKSTR